MQLVITILPRAAEVILPFIAAKIDEASLATFNEFDMIFKTQIRVKYSIFTGPAILLINKIEPVERSFVSQNINNFGNDNSTNRPTFISKKYAGSSDFNVEGSFLKIFTNFNKTFCYILLYPILNLC